MSLSNRGGEPLDLFRHGPWRSRRGTRCLRERCSSRSARPRRGSAARCSSASSLIGIPSIARAAAHGSQVLLSQATAELGVIAYESAADDGAPHQGMIVSENLILEIVRPVFLKGYGVAELWPSYVWLLGIAAVALGWARLRLGHALR